MTDDIVKAIQMIGDFLFNVWQEWGFTGVFIVVGIVAAVALALWLYNEWSFRQIPLLTEEQYQEKERERREREEREWQQMNGN